MESVLEAIRNGVWDYEPFGEEEENDYEPTVALPGTDEKLAVLVSRIERGLPLWHPNDRCSYDETEAANE